jgi:hypothetical protein
MRKRDRLPLQKNHNLAGTRPLEQLEQRRMFAVGAGSFDIDDIPLNNPTTTDVSDVKSGPMANAGDALIALYRDYRRAQNSGVAAAAFTSSLGSYLVIDEGRVAVTLRARNGVDKLKDAITGAGGDIIITNGNFSAVSAFVPIDQLRALAGNASVATIAPVTRFATNNVGTGNNQADDTQLTNLVRATYGLDGTGVKIGVISDSANLVGQGVAGSVGTGDLPEGAVEIIEDTDLNFAPTDEGRAMMELIHDIAPGASLAFATALPTQDNFAANVRALREAGCDIIVDDVIYFAEPIFQPGVIDGAIKEFVDDGGIYLSAVGNFDRSGYDSLTRFTKVGGVNFVDFDSSPRVDTKMRITVTTGGTLTFEWDNPYNGVVGNATTDLDIYFYDPVRPTRILAQGTTNNLKTGLPLELVTLPAGTYDVTIRVSDRTPGSTLPTRFKMVGGIGLDTTEYNDGLRSGTWGHNAGPSTISVGAVPFAEVPPFGDADATINNETFSSIGPVVHTFDINGNRFSAPKTLNKPDLSGIDGTNTSFFDGSGTNPLPFSGDIPEDEDILPNFFGTSAAAPNVAAAIALIKEAAPSATQEQILNALKSTAKPLNSATRGQFDPQGGYGLIDAFAAVKQFITNPSIKLIPSTTSPTYSSIDRLKIVFSQQVSNFDVSDLFLTVNDGDNLLTGNNAPVSKDGGRTWYVRNLNLITSTNGTYVFRFNDDISPVTNILGLHLLGDPSISWTKRARPAVPANPTNLRASRTAESTVLLRWDDNATSEAGYVVQRTTDPTFKTGIKAFYIGADRTTYTDSQLPVGAGTIYYRVRAFNSLKQYSEFTDIVHIAALSPGEVVIDNESESGVTVRGLWNTNDDNTGFLGDNYLDDDNDDKGDKSVTYRPSLLASGQYYIYIRWTRAGDRATNVPVDVNINGKTQTFVINQRSGGGNGWVLLGQFALTKGTGTNVTIRTDGTDGRVIADAVRFLPANAGIIA